MTIDYNVNGISKDFMYTLKVSINVQLLSEVTVSHI